ncbi:MAG TPA: alkaline phosphatase PhoX [Thermoleophilaceae bacterium]
MYRRRELLQASLIGTGALAFGLSFWRDALAAPAKPGPGPYGPLQPADANGIMLPQGFTSRAIAQGGQPVAGTGYQWHVFSDGQATYRTDDGGFILVSNSENPPDLNVDTPDEVGGASAIRFRADGTIADAYRILSGTRVNCAGGATPWGTWLSCEEHTRGQVWECDPTGKAAGVARPAMGFFEHEAVCVDPAGKRVYLSEDNGEGGLYRFTPDRYPDLSAGVLEVAKVGAGGVVEWARVPDPSASSAPTRQQVEGMTRFQRGEGIWFDGGVVYLCTTTDSKIHTYDTKTNRMDVVYDAGAIENPPLTQVDNITVSRSGDIFVCEDTTNSSDPGLDIGLITTDGTVTRFLKVTGSAHTGANEARSELCGVVFDPSGDRLLFSSQRGFVTGVIYEITGPFRSKPPARRGGTHGFRVHVPPRVTTRTFLDRGLPFSIVTSKAIDVSAKITADLPSSGKSRRTTLAHVSRDIDEEGRYKLHLRPKGSTRSRVARERSFRARVTITATDAAGVRRVIKRSVRVARRFGTG